VKFAFLNGVLEEEIYVEQVLNFVVKSNKDKVLKLKKTLYGLKQAPRPGITELTTTSVNKDSKGVRVGQHSTSRLKVTLTPPLSLCMLMILSIWETTNKWFKSSKNILWRLLKWQIWVWCIISLGYKSVKKIKEYLSKKMYWELPKKNSRWYDANQLLLYSWLIRNYKRKLDKKKNRCINIQKFNW